MDRFQIQQIKQPTLNTFRFIGAQLLGFPLFILLYVIRTWSQSDGRKYNGPRNTILAISHVDAYLASIHPWGTDLGILLLGNHSKLSYCWYLWQWRERFKVARYQLDGSSTPLDQVIALLQYSPNEPLCILSDSGGPYGLMRPSLIKMATESKRSIVMMRFFSSKSVQIRQHKIPLPSSFISVKCSAPIEADTLARLTPSDALRTVQKTWENLHQD